MINCTDHMFKGKQEEGDLLMTNRKPFLTSMEMFDQKFEVVEYTITTTSVRYDISSIESKPSGGEFIDSTETKYSIIEKQSSAIVADNLSKEKISELYSNLLAEDDREILRPFLEKEVHEENKIIGAEF